MGFSKPLKADFELTTNKHFCKVIHLQMYLNKGVVAIASTSSAASGLVTVKA